MADSYVLARLVCRDVDGEDFWVAQYSGGAYTYISIEDLDDPEPGQLVLVGQQRGGVHPAPPGMRWGTDWRALGTVRHLTDSETILEIGSVLRSFPAKREDLRPGDVVSISDDDGIGDRVGQESDFSPDKSDTDGKRFELPKMEGQPAAFIGTDILKLVRRFVEGPILHKREYAVIGVMAPKGVLFVGPPGTGKTMLARSIAQRTDADFFLINGPEIMSRYVGDAELTLRNVFKEAEKRERAIIFIDEIDSIAPARKAEDNESSVRIVGMLLTLMDDVRPSSNVLVLGATNRVSSLDRALRRGGRFQAEIDFPLPDLESRISLLSSARDALKVAASVDVLAAAAASEGWSGADVAELWQQAGWNAAFDGRVCIAQEDLDIALIQVGRQVVKREIRSREDAQDSQGI